MEKAKIISVLDVATNEIAKLLGNNKLDVECEDQLCQTQQLLLSLLHQLINERTLCTQKP